jgi:hypothetical protein
LVFSAMSTVPGHIVSGQRTPVTMTISMDASGNPLGCQSLNGAQATCLLYGGLWNASLTPPCRFGFMPQSCSPPGGPYTQYVSQINTDATVNCSNFAIVCPAGDALVAIQNGVPTCAPISYTPDVNGLCGTANGQSYATAAAATAAGLCSTGTPTVALTDPGPWTWGCNGVGIGTSTAPNACSANVSGCPAGTTLSWTVAGTTCNAISAATAAGGTLPVASTTPVGGATFSCSATGTWVTPPLATPTPSCDAAGSCGGGATYFHGLTGRSCPNVDRAAVLAVIAAQGGTTDITPGSGSCLGVTVTNPGDFCLENDGVNDFARCDATVWLYKGCGAGTAINCPAGRTLTWGVGTNTCSGTTVATAAGTSGVRVSDASGNSAYFDCGIDGVWNPINNASPAPVCAAAPPVTGTCSCLSITFPLGYGPPAYTCPEYDIGAAFGTAIISTDSPNPSSPSSCQTARGICSADIVSACEGGYCTFQWVGPLDPATCASYSGVYSAPNCTITF